VRTFYKELTDRWGCRSDNVISHTHITNNRALVASPLAAARFAPHRRSLLTAAHRSISHTALGISNMNTVATDFFKYVANDTVPYFLEKGGTPAQIAMIMYSLASARCKFGDHPLLEHGFAVNELWQALLAEHVRGGEGFTTETLRFMHMTYLIARSADYYFPATPSKALAEEVRGQEEQSDDCSF